MSDREPVHVRLALRLVPHFVFFVVVGSALVRLGDLNTPRCWYIVTVSGLLAAAYAAGPAAGPAVWSRLGALARHLWVAGMLLLWVVLVVIVPAPLNGTYVWCAVPLACAALSALGPRSGGTAVAAITVVLVGQLARTAGHFDPETVLIPVAAVWATVVLYRAQQRDATERQRLVEELRSTREILAEQQRRAGVVAERARIARDLHDTLAQELAGNLMLLQAAERDWAERPDVARTRVRAVADGLDAGLAETRRIIRDLAPSAVAEAGLEGSLRLLCTRAQADGTAARVQFRSVGDHRPALDQQAAAALFRVAQSLLANVREHAHAMNLLVTLRQHPDRVELEVCDDGVGFGPAEMLMASRPGRGFGLPSARARLRECGGDLDVGGAPGGGAQVRAALPARPQAAPVMPVRSATAR
ncbi:sensor histidine kinase [Streptomyces sp. NBC_01262]|uniref:sensor histidine kinase n=1 Tax=Streptomyces sp. NBC_01262 TaxID=2903803 RepID=UPI002E333530|nr:histidine kinase [Streptomyces sp. NBC_01262]